MAAKRSYPTSEVRGGDERSYPTSEVRGSGGEEIPHASRPRPGVAARRTKPKSKEWWLQGLRRAKRSYCMLKARKGDSEEIPLVQGKEQRLHLAGDRKSVV